MAIPNLKTIDAAGRTIGYREAGAGEAIIFLHGIGSGSSAWEAQIDRFSGRYRAIAWDAPGYGGSGDFEDESPDVGEYADALKDFMDALGIEAAHLVGNSLGSLMAGGFARRYRDRVLSLFLSDPAIGHAKSDPKVKADALQMRLDLVYDLGPEEMARQRGPGIIAPDASPEAIERVVSVMAQVRPDGYARAARMLSNGNLLAEIEGCDAPALVATGELDTVTPPKGGRKVADTLANGRFVLMPGLGHLPYAEAPEDFNNLLADFLESLERAAA